MLHRRNYESSGGMGAPASSTFSKRIGFTLMILFQVIPAGVVGVGYYVLAMAMTVYDGFISLLIQPVMGAFITLIAIVLLLIAGLPLRLIGWLNRWWRRHWWLSFLLGAAAFGLMVVSWMPSYRIQVFDPELRVMAESFHPVLAVSGWLLTLFAVLHFYPPWPKWSRQ